MGYGNLTTLEPGGIRIGRHRMLRYFVHEFVNVLHYKLASQNSLQKIETENENTNVCVVYSEKREGSNLSSIVMNVFFNITQQ